MTEPAAEAPPDAPATRWPVVLGVLGIVLSLLTLFDQVGDLLVLTVSEGNWSRWLGPEVASLVSRVMPPKWWIVITSLVWSALAVLLLRGSLALRLRRRSGVSLCEIWCGLAIVWIVVDFNLGLWWLRRVRGELPMPSSGIWQGAAVFGALFGLVLLLAYPVFLQVWLKRAVVIAEYGAWEE